MSSSLRVNTIVPSTGTNVAIGTANGTVTFTDSVNFVLGTGSSIFSPASNTLTFGTNDAERLRITSAGNIGIGTDNPNSTAGLDVLNGEICARGVRSSSSKPIAGVWLGKATGGNAVVELVGDNNSTAEIDFTSPNTDTKGRVGYDLTNNYMYFYTNGANERLRITSGGGVGINIAAPVSQLQVNTVKNAETDRHNATNYALALRNPNDNNGEAIGLSFGITSNTTKVGAAILHERDGGGSTGSLQFYTSPDGNGVTERLRITSSGALNLSSPSNTVAAGLLNVPNGSRVSSSVTPRGTYATGNGGVVDMARYEMIDKCITSFPANNNKICAINGAPLYINDTRQNWERYYSLPNYLLGTLTHDCINNSSFSVTLACTMTVFLGRSSGWNSVSLTGWNLIESGTGIGPFGTDTRLYVKTLAAGTHTLDNDSAMYFFSL